MAKNPLSNRMADVEKAPSPSKAPRYGVEVRKPLSHRLGLGGGTKRRRGDVTKTARGAGAAQQAERYEEKREKTPGFLSRVVNNLSLIHI